MGFHGLAMPPTGVFARLTGIYLSRIWCPCLQRLTVEDSSGLGNLAINSVGLAAATGAQQPARVVAGQYCGAGAHSA
jgi:hypothetical protein